MKLTLNDKTEIRLSFYLGDQIEMNLEQPQHDTKTPSTRVLLLPHECKVLITALQESLKLK